MIWQIGANLSALEDGSSVPGEVNTDYALPTDTEFDFLLSKNLKVVRLPFMWERLQPNLFSPLDARYLGYIQAAVAKAAARGMRVVLDCHNYGGYGGAKIGAGKVTAGDLADLWSRLAAVFSGDATIAAYDIMNEPSNMPTLDTWQQAAQSAITAIRASDSQTAIFVEGNNYSSAFTWVRQNPTLHLLTDPSHLLVFSAHAYLDRDNSGTHYVWADEIAAGDQLSGRPLDTSIGVRRVTEFVGWLRAHGLKGNVGETGAGFNDPNWLSALDLEIEFLLKHRVSFIYWNLGPFFRSYPYSIEPDGTGIDKVQVAVLTKYTRAAQPTTYAVDVLPSSAVGRPSLNVKLSYRGLIRKPIIFIPDDADGGGMFEPSAVTMPAGFNGVASFTYRHTGGKGSKIAITNSVGLFDPPEIVVQ